jgi:hypothetical protein
MGRYFGARGASKPTTEAERRVQAAFRAHQTKERIKALSEAAKIKALGRAIAVNVIAKSSFSETDLALAGFTAEEGKLYFEPALAYARRIEPAIDAAMVAP